MMRLLVLLCLLFSALRIPAAELADLGQGLAYLRVKSADDSLKAITAAVRERDALVLDVRYATTSADAAAALRSALAGRSGKPAVFLLVSPETPTALAAVLSPVPPGVLALGVPDSRPGPQVVIDQPAAADRRAYDAAGSGHPLTSLISGKIEKERYDEASLVREFNGGHTDAAPPPAPDPTAKAAPGPDAEKAPVLTDRVLQRAVHLHRALLALKPR